MLAVQTTFPILWLATVSHRNWCSENCFFCDGYSQRVTLWCIFCMMHLVLINYI